MAPDKSKNTPPVSPHSFHNEEDEEEPFDRDTEAFEVIDLTNEEFMDEDIDPEEGEGAAATAEDEEIIIDNSLITFPNHGESIFSVDCSNSSLIVSGGQDDSAYIWNSENAQVFLKCEGFKDSVVYSKFNHDGSYVAIGDMSGLIKVWKISSSRVVWEFETADISWMEWHSASNVLFVGTTESELWMWKIPSGESKIYMGNGEKIECASILQDGKKVGVGYGDGSIKIFDLKMGTVLFNSNDEISKHKTSVNCIDSSQGFLGTGSLDGAIKIIALQSGKIVNNLSCHDSSSESADAIDSAVECLLFSKDKSSKHLYSGTLNGKVTVWDTSSGISRHSSILGSGVVKILIRNSNQDHLFVATLDGVVVIFDTLTGTVLGNCTGHKGSILDMQQFKSGDKIVTSSDDGTCKVFDILKITNEFVR